MLVVGNVYMIDLYFITQISYICCIKVVNICHIKMYNSSLWIQTDFLLHFFQVEPQQNIIHCISFTYIPRKTVLRKPIVATSPVREFQHTMEACKWVILIVTFGLAFILISVIQNIFIGTWNARSNGTSQPWN
jgi:hypothetical protein